MIISFYPQCRPDALTASKAGDVLTINGETYDFSSLPDGSTIAEGSIPCPWIIGPVERLGGHLHLTLILPHDWAPSPAVAFPAPLTVTADGPVAIPHDLPPEMIMPEIEEPEDVDA